MTFEKNIFSFILIISLLYFSSLLVLSFSQGCYYEIVENKYQINVSETEQECNFGILNPNVKISLILTTNLIFLIICFLLSPVCVKTHTFKGGMKADDTFK